MFFKVHVLMTLFFSCSAWSASGVSYHGRIIKPNNLPLESATVRFRIQIKSAGSESCLLWQEEQSRNMLGSNGTFSITIGDSSDTTVNYTRVDAYSWGIDRVFSNRSAFTNLVGCTVGDNYIPNAADGRILQVSFKEQPTDPVWETFPATKINLIPMSLNSLQLEGFRATEFLKIDPLVGQVPISNAGVNTLLGLIAGTSNTYVKPLDPLGGDLAGNFGAGTVVGIRGRAVANAIPSAGQILKFDGAAWVPSADDTGTDPGDASYAAKGIVQFDTSAAISGMTVTAGVAKLTDLLTAAGPTGGASVVPIITYDAKGRLTAVSTAAVNDTTKLPLSGGTMTGAINMGLFNVTNATSVASTNFSGRNLILNDNDSDTATIRSPADISTSYSLTLPAAAPTNGSVLSSDGTGQLSWIAAATGAVTSVTATAPVLSSGGVTPVISLDTGLLANKIPQVGGLPLLANGVIVANATGTALMSLNCAIGQVIKFDASAIASCANDESGAANAFVNGGNSFATDATIGTNDAYVLNFETQGTTKMTVLANGNVGIGTTLPSSPLHIAGETIQIGPSGRIFSSSTYSNFVAIGANNNVSDSFGAMANVVAIGAANTVNFRNSTAIGRGNTTGPGDTALAMGIGNSAATDSALAIGRSNTSSASTAIAIGAGVLNNVANSLMLGPSNAAKLTILSTGSVGVGTIAPAEKLDVNGAIKLGSTTTTNAGTIRWDGTNFQGFNGSAWTNFVPNPPSAGACDATDIYSTPGTYSYTVPANFGTLTIRIWGAGGAGASAYDVAGSDGGNSSVLSLGLVAGGGKGAITTAGAGGTANGGTVNTNGQSGANGVDGTGGGTGGGAPNGGTGGLGAATSGSLASSGASPGGGGGGGTYGSGLPFTGAGGGGGAYVEKAFTSATLTPGTSISDIVVGNGGVGSGVYLGGSGGVGRVSIACATAGQLPANDRGILFWNAGSHDSSTTFVHTAAGNVGIGTSSPTQKLSVAGTIESTSGGVRFPDGTTQTTAFQSYGFSSNGSSQSIASAVSTTMINPVVLWNRGNGYDSATGVFTPPATGIYQCNCRANFETLSASTDFFVGLSGTNIEGNSNIGERNRCAAAPCSTETSQLVKANASATIACRVYQASGSSFSLQGDFRTSFSCQYLGP